MKIEVEKKEQNTPELETLYLINDKGTWVYQQENKYSDRYVSLHSTLTLSRETLVTHGYTALPKGSKIIITV